MSIETRWTIVGVFAVWAALLSQVGRACSMVCFTDASGRAWVGNNEDFINPDTWMWTIPREQGKYGAVCFGYGNRFPQGGMNEVGLAFDGFAMEPLEVKKIHGKEKISPPDLITKLMQTCETTKDVKALLLMYRLDFLSNAQLMFADRHGASLIVEGDAMFEKAAGEPQVCTNFYRSRIKSEQEISCERYVKGKQLIPDACASRNGKAKCVTLLKSMCQTGSWGGTQYSNVYDPAGGKVSLFLFHNFKEEVDLSVAKLLDDAKGPVKLAELFEDRGDYDSFRAAYETADTLTKRLEAANSCHELGKVLADLATLPQSRLFGSRIIAALETQVAQKQWALAKRTGELCTNLFPDSKEAFAALGKAYFETGLYEAAANHVDHALELNPNDAVLENLKTKIMERIKQQSPE